MNFYVKLCSSMHSVVAMVSASPPPARLGAAVANSSTDCPRTGVGSRGSVGFECVTTGAVVNRHASALVAAEIVDGDGLIAQPSKSVAAPRGPWAKHFQGAKKLWFLNLGLKKSTAGASTIITVHIPLTAVVSSDASNITQDQIGSCSGLYNPKQQLPARHQYVHQPATAVFCVQGSYESFFQSFY